MRSEPDDPSSSPRPPAGASLAVNGGPGPGRSNGAVPDRDAILRLHNLTTHNPAADHPGFQGVDLWRWQYFEGVALPPSLVIPVDDPTGWVLYPAYRRVYNKLFICDSQGIPNGPHGTMPNRFPVFSKPMMNLHGMGAGGRIIRSAAELEAHFTPGHMWLKLFTGRHVSTDAALLNGRVRWRRHTVGKPLPGGTFDYWTILARPLPKLEGYLDRWIRRNLAGFTGLVNFESMGGAIIEVHLRMSEQWIDLNGPGWLRSAIDLYAHGRWSFAGRPVTGYSIVLFRRHGPHAWIDPAAVATLRGVPGIASIQITYDPSRAPEQHAMPPGGFRLAIINAWDLAAGLAVRDRLKRLFTTADSIGRHAHEAVERTRRNGRVPSTAVG